MTSLERLTRLRGTPAGFVANREFWILHEFRRRAHILIPSQPRDECRLEWMALIQHYGGPTRLLDFTHSFYIAAFFALESASVDACVWGVDLNELDRLAGVQPGSQTKDIRNRANIAEVEAILKQVKGKRRRGVLHVEPERLNERMAVQQGVFLFPKDITCSFMENLAEGVGKSGTGSVELNVSTFFGQIDNLRSSPALIKIILPRAWHNSILEDLHRMNVDAASLFPGLEGFAIAAEACALGVGAPDSALHGLGAACSVLSAVPFRVRLQAGELGCVSFSLEPGLPF